MSLRTPVRRRLRPAASLLAAAALLPLLAAPAGAAERKLYVSLGDSYAAGVQATGPGQPVITRKGFADQLVRLARRRGHRLKLVNFACGGETTASFLRRTARCGGPAVGGPDYRGRTQAAAATRFLRRHRGEVGLITVSLGGNDVLGCAAPGVADPVACISDATERIERNLGRIVRRLRAAAGRRVRIVGTTYPDVALARWLSGQPAEQDFARLSVVAFRDFINPALREQYRSVGGRFVDVTAATGAYGPLEETTTLAPYGEIPKPVAEVCRLTFICDYGDIHARTRGYRAIAELIAATLRPAGR